MGAMGSRAMRWVAGVCVPVVMVLAMATAHARAEDPVPVRSNDPGITLEPPRVVQRAVLPYRLVLPQLGRDGLAPIAQERYATGASVTRIPGSVGIEVAVSGQDTGPVLVQVEIYNAANVRVFEQKWDGTALGPGQPRTLRAAWDTRAASAGAYVVRVGIFAPGAGWGVLYHWNNDAARFAIE